MKNVTVTEKAEEIQVAMQKAVHEAIMMHRFLGNPIAVSIDGKVVVAPVDEIIELQRKSDQEKQNKQNQNSPNAN